MANRFWVNGGDGLWGSTNNWSTTSGGGGGSSVPSNADDVFFDANSPACTVNTGASRTCRQLDMNGWPAGRTLTLNTTLTCTPQNTGIIRFSNNTMSFAGSSGITITCATACTITTNAQAITCPIILNGTGTFTLADNWNQDGLLTYNGSSNLVMTGNTISLGGGLTQGSNLINVSGTTAFVFDAPGTWTGGGAGGTNVSLSITFNLSGTLSLSGTIAVNAATLTYTAGTVSAGSSILRVLGGTTFNCSAVTWNDVNIGATGSINPVLLADVNVGNDLTLAETSNATLTITGAFNFNVSRHLNLNGANSSVMTSSNSTVVMVGTGTITGAGVGSTNAVNRINITINTAGTITFSGGLNWDTRTLKYTAGTLAFASTPVINMGVLTAATSTLDMAGQTMNLELRQNVIAGATCRLASGWVVGATGKLTFTGTAASPQVLNSTSGGTQRKLTITPGAIIDVGYTSPTDIDCGDGDKLWMFKGTQSNCVNIGALTPYTSPLGAYAGGAPAAIGAFG